MLLTDAIATDSNIFFSVFVLTFVLDFFRAYLKKFKKSPTLR